MKVLIDVNILLDLILARAPWDRAAAELLSAVEAGRIAGYVAGHTIPAVHYVVAKARDRGTATAAVADLLRLVDVVPIDKTDLYQALALPVDDFEDAVQVAAARKVSADFIVTRNESDFQSGGIPTVRAEALLADR